MKWVLIAALWNTPVPQQSFKFLHLTYESKEQCQAAVQVLYSEAFNNGFQAQATCVADKDMGLGPAY